MRLSLRFKNGEDARKALVQLNGMDIAGQKIKVGLVNEGSAESQEDTRLDDEGISLNARGKALLMAKLSGQQNLPSVATAQMALPTSSPMMANPLLAMNPALMQQMLSNPALMASLGGRPGMLPGLMALPGLPVPGLPGLNLPGGMPLGGAMPQAPPAVDNTPCLMMKNLFDPAEETEEDYDEDIKEDVSEECHKYGKLEHIHVVKGSQGDVYIRFDAPSGAQKAYNALHNRWFAKKMITCEYIPLERYRQMFPF